ncbi:DinB family protein [Macrococcus animalis]|uniref:DinB family protein n=1 Tax=Macrococcus animalis TaxID=3395467 RepID=UPI0039BF33BE
MNNNNQIYTEVKHSRDQLLNQIKLLSKSQFNYNFGSKFKSIKYNLLQIAYHYHENLSGQQSNIGDYDLFKEKGPTLTFTDIENYFDNIDYAIEQHPIHPNDVMPLIFNEYEYRGKIKFLMTFFEVLDSQLDNEIQNLKVTQLK